jgi:hypothetical protein
MDVSHQVGLPPDVPLEDATLMASLGVDTTIENPLDMLMSKPSHKSDNEFSSVGFKTDKTDGFVTALVRKVTVHHTNGSYFGWKGLGFNVVCAMILCQVISH